MEEDGLSQAALADGDETKGPTLYSSMPPEIIEHTARHLDNRSLKSLRLTCRLFGALKLRINRVFITPNTKDIQTFYAIAESDVYRPKVVEVIYDDAFVGGSLQYYSSMAASHTTNSNTNQPPLESRPRENVGGTNRVFGIDNGSRFKCRRAQRPDDVPRFTTEIKSEQEENIEKGLDADALRYALRHLPALQRITVTPATSEHTAPLYETPARRAALPFELNDPTLFDWAFWRGGGHGTFVKPWEEDKPRWRGYNMVTKLMAEEKQHHHVSEFLIGTHYLYKGLNCRLFEQACEEYDNFQTILQQPNFKKLQLSLHVRGEDQRQWAAFRNNLLRNAIAEASQLEQFSMETDWERDIRRRNIQPPRLRTFLPIERWAGLQHFRLAKFPLRSADLISTLSKLTGLQSLELVFLNLCEGDNYHDLLNGMRGTLQLHKRVVQPTVRLGIPIPVPAFDLPVSDSYDSTMDCLHTGRAIWIDREVEAFLYQDGENPFVAGEDTLARVMGVVKDDFDPGYERLYEPPVDPREQF
ncbi:hypothetical protein ACQKWADRAFT_245452 [Trichoderma austrokoningii]